MLVNLEAGTLVSPEDHGGPFRFSRLRLTNEVTPSATRSHTPEGSGTAHWKSDNDLDDVILAFTSGITTPDSTVKMTDVSVPAPTPRTARK